jgi:hypothetical protein
MKLSEFWDSVLDGLGSIKTAITGNRLTVEHLHGGPPEFCGDWLRCREDVADWHWPDGVRVSDADRKALGLVTPREQRVPPLLIGAVVYGPTERSSDVYSAKAAHRFGRPGFGVHQTRGYPTFGVSAEGILPGERNAQY